MAKEKIQKYRLTTTNRLTFSRIAEKPQNLKSIKIKSKSPEPSGSGFWRYAIQRQSALESFVEFKNYPPIISKVFCVTKSVSYQFAMLFARRAPYPNHFKNYRQLYITSTIKFEVLIGTKQMQLEFWNGMLPRFTILILYPALKKRNQ